MAIDALARELKRGSTELLRRRRYYRLTAAGRKTLKSQRSTWENFFEGLNRVARITQA